MLQYIVKSGPAGNRPRHRPDIKKSGTVWYHAGHMVRTVDFTHNRCISCLWPVVYIATMADLEQKDNQFSLIDLTDDPIIPDTVSP